MCLVEDIMNTLDDCDLLEKVVNMTNVHEHNDVTDSVNKSATIQIFSCKVCILYFYLCFVRMPWL